MYSNHMIRLSGIQASIATKGMRNIMNNLNNLFYFKSIINSNLEKTSNCLSKNIFGEIKNFSSIVPIIKNKIEDEFKTNLMFFLMRSNFLNFMKPNNKLVDFYIFLTTTFKRKKLKMKKHKCSKRKKKLRNIQKSNLKAK